MNETIEQQVDKAIAEGRRVQEAVREITLEALSKGRLDLEAMRKVTGEAVAAVRETATRHDAHARNAVREALQGIERALAQAAEAMKLSIQEAGGRVGTFSSEELAKARADLAAVEKMFVETLSEAAQAARGAAKATLEDLARHAEASGTAIGRQMRESAELSAEAADAVRKQFRAGLEAAAASGAVFARAAAGVLAAIAGTLERKQKR